MNPLQRSIALAAIILVTAGFGSAHAQEAPAPAPIVEPEAKAALDRMGAYLRTLNSFEIKTETTLDLVTDAGQRISLDGTGAYKVRRPNAFVISVNTDWKKRTFYYDGKQFTVFAPELGFYAQAAAPGTIKETLDVVWDKFGIALPIEDLFRWNDPSQRSSEQLDLAMHVGPATIDGQAAEHYAFRQGDVDWQIWIKTGAQALPLKLVIVDRTEPAQPAYSARLRWTLDPQLTNDDFVFRPGKDAKAIRLTGAASGSFQ